MGSRNPDMYLMTVKDYKIFFFNIGTHTMSVSAAVGTSLEVGGVQISSSVPTLLGSCCSTGLFLVIFKFLIRSAIVFFAILPPTLYCSDILISVSMFASISRPNF